MKASHALLALIIGALANVASWGAAPATEPLSGTGAHVLFASVRMLHQMAHETVAKYRNP